MRNILRMRARTLQPFSDGDAGTLRGFRCVSELGSDPARWLWIPYSRQFLLRIAARQFILFLMAKRTSVSKALQDDPIVQLWVRPFLVKSKNLVLIHKVSRADPWIGCTGALRRIPRYVLRISPARTAP